MSVRLIFARKVQVNIGLLISVKAQKGLERDIIAVLVVLRAALFAELVLHIHTLAVRIETDEDPLPAMNHV